MRFEALITEGLIPYRLRRAEIWLLENHRFSRNTEKYPAACGGDFILDEIIMKEIL